MILTARRNSLTESQKFYFLLSLLFCGGSILFLFDTPFSPLGPYTLCLFRNITGVPCPGCGMGRGVQYLLHLQLGDALYMNPLSVIILPSIMITLGWMLRDFFARDESLFRFYQKFDKYFFRNKSAAAMIAIVIIAVWLWNILKP